MNVRLPVVFLALGTFAQAQFYAPDTDFHDSAQRTFPVEAARVLAWQRNRAGAKITEVKFDVQTTAERETVWTIRWLDANGQPVREKTVRYPEALLLAGPEFFHNVFQQLTGDDWKPGSVPQDDAAATYWKGAELAGVSRLDAVEAASALLAEKPGVPRPDDAARLAGILVEGAMPSISNSMMLDAVLLSRGAAWLCTAETQSDSRFPAAWAPLLFLAGREPVAGELWAGLPPLEDPTTPERFWDFQLRKPSTRECFRFAIRPENRAFAMPAMMWPHHFDQRWSHRMLEVIPEILPEGMIERYYEFGPNISIKNTGYRGALFSAPMPDLAVSALTLTLRDFQPEPGDFTGYRDVLPEIREGRATFSVPKFAPLLNLGYEHPGALRPVAHVTTCDLLNYGWEQAGLQLGYTYRAGGGQKAAGARAFGELVLEKIKGVDIFFLDMPRTEPVKDLRRWQYVSSSVVSDALRDHVREWEKPADMMYRRRWLLGDGGNRQLEAMIRYGAPEEECRAMVERLQREGGPRSYSFLLSDDADTKYPDLLYHFGLRWKLAQSVPWSFNLNGMAIYDQFWGKDDPLGLAQALEAYEWREGATLEYRGIFQRYVEAGALEAAKRYYDQIQPYMRDSGAAGQLGTARFALAWLENDDAGMRRALANAQDGYNSGRDMMIVYALVRGDVDIATKTLEASPGVYGDEKNRAALQSWLPLLPALRDPQSPDHARAIDSFPPGYQGWLFLRWALGVSAKLPPEEAARLLATEGDDLAQLLMAAARGDKGRFEALYTDQTRAMRYTEDRVLAADLRRRLRGLPTRTDVADLKPDDAIPIGEVIREALSNR